MKQRDNILTRAIRQAARQTNDAKMKVWASRLLRGDKQLIRQRRGARRAG